MVVSCCVINCTSRFDKNSPGSFYHIPKKPDERRKQRLAAIKRVGPDGKQWEPTDHDRICFRHFITGRFVDHFMTLNGCGICYFFFLLPNKQLSTNLVAEFMHIQSPQKRGVGIN